MSFFSAVRDASIERRRQLETNGKPPHSSSSSSGAIVAGTSAAAAAATAPATATAGPGTVLAASIAQAPVVVDRGGEAIGVSPVAESFLRKRKADERDEESVQVSPGIGSLKRKPPGSSVHDAIELLSSDDDDDADDDDDDDDGPAAGGARMYAGCVCGGLLCGRGAAARIRGFEEDYEDENDGADYDGEEAHDEDDDDEDDDGDDDDDDDDDPVIISKPASAPLPAVVPPPLSAPAIAAVRPASSAAAAATAASTSLLDRLRPLVECEICFEAFDDTTRIPRILSCGHTVCAACLVGMVTDAGSTPQAAASGFIGIPYMPVRLSGHWKIVCPFDGETTEVGAGLARGATSRDALVARLPKNWSLAAVARAVAQ
jgi:hypothetical protein